VPKAGIDVIRRPLIRSKIPGSPVQLVWES
jgi:hypothetical protein